MKTSALIKELKENDQDFEYYPTTKKMLKIIIDDIKAEDLDEYLKIVPRFSLMDVGAGEGNVFRIIEDLLPKDERGYNTQIEKFAIEKSKILIEKMPNDVIIVGTNFLQQTLIDKKVDIIFCNPPYKEFEQWMLKIIKEANCKTIYLIIPERWKNNPKITKLINKRLNINEYDNPEYKAYRENRSYYKILNSQDFIDSEYRKSRAKIDILKIQFDEHQKKDPFDIWFEENFKINAETESVYCFEQNKKETIKQEIIKGRNLIETLAELHQKDLEKLRNNYKKLEDIDAELFKEMNVDFGQLKEALKKKISGLKNLYWHELFDNLKKITDKLTSKSRKQILDKLSSQTNIDFSVNNAYALIIWVLKNANIYIDEQLKEIYFEMADKQNIINYKSNKKFIEDGWRYSTAIRERSYTRFKLDYRLVFKRHYCFDRSGYNDYDYPNGLYRSVHDFLNDICTIGNNLGFEFIDSSMNFQWQPGQEKIFYYGDRNEEKEFMRIRAYKNGNIHCKPNQEFIKRLNIEMARINKWIKNQKECAEELDLPIEEINQYFYCNKKFIKSNILLSIGEVYRCGL